MTELANAEDLVREFTEIADAAAELPEGLTMVSGDFAMGEREYDERRKRYFRECAEWIDGRWEGFVSLEAAR
jgi:hypothetical protein